MLDPDDFLGKVSDFSAVGVSNIQTGGIKLDPELAIKDCDERVEENISLSQYYSRFIDGTCEDTPQYYTSEVSEPRAEYDSTLMKNVSEPHESIDGKDVNQPSEKIKKPIIWKCTYRCGKIFTKERYMRKHIMIMHENANLVQCKVCYKFLSTQARLKNHMLRHSDVDHLVCLICTIKRASNLSCIRHHLFQKHGISGKHPLFHESFYTMSLKEISLMKKCKNKRKTRIESKEMQEYPGDFRKSANDIDELNWKIMEKSKRVKNLLSEPPKTSESVEKEVKKVEEETPKGDIPPVTPKNTSKVNQPQKILTAENGMKLIKLPNGHFKKITSVLTLFPTSVVQENWSN